MPRRLRRLQPDPMTLRQDWAPVSLHVGMRYHAHVLAALAGKPFCGLAHDNKVEEICRAYAMPCAQPRTSVRRRCAHES